MKPYGNHKWNPKWNAKNTLNETLSETTTEALKNTAWNPTWNLKWHPKLTSKQSSGNQHERLKQIPCKWNVGMPKYDKYHAQWKAHIVNAKCSKYNEKCKVTMPKCSKYRCKLLQIQGKWHQERKQETNPKSEAQKKQKLCCTLTETEGSTRGINM